jgi:hypothetical protein
MAGCFGKESVFVRTGALMFKPVVTYVTESTVKPRYVPPPRCSDTLYSGLENVEQKFPVTQYFDIPPQIAVNKQWRCVGG